MMSKNKPTTISYPSILFAGFLCSAISCGDRQAATRAGLQKSQSVAGGTDLSTVPKKLVNDVVTNEGAKAQIILDFWNIVATELHTQLGDALQHKHPIFKSLESMENATFEIWDDSFKDQLKSYLSTFGKQGFKGEARTALAALNNLSDSRSVKKRSFKRIKLQEDKIEKKRNILVAKALQHIVDIQNELASVYGITEQYVKSLNVQERAKLKNKALKSIGDISKCSDQLHGDFVFSTKKDRKQGLIYDKKKSVELLQKQEVVDLFQSNIMDGKGPRLYDFLAQFLIRSDGPEENRIILKVSHPGSLGYDVRIYVRFLDLLDAAQQGPEAFLACMQEFKATKGLRSTNKNDGGDLFVCNYNNEHELSGKLQIAIKSDKGGWLPTEWTEKLAQLLAQLRPHFASEKYLGTCMRYDDLKDQFSGFDVAIVRTFFEESTKNLRGTLLLDPKSMLAQTDLQSAWKDATGWEIGQENIPKLEKLSQDYKK